MPYLFLAMAGSAAMAIVLKCFRGRRGNRYGIILGNYLTCVLIALALMPERKMILSGSASTLLCGIAAGLIYVAGLVSMQSSIRLSGAALTAAFSKMGLLVSLAVSVFWFGERPTGPALAGVILAVAAVALIHAPRADRSGETAEPPAFSLLLLTLLTNGAAEAMAKVFQELGGRGEDELFFFWLFLTAAVLSTVLALGERRRTGKRLLLPELAAGVAVGVPNFFASYLVLLALERMPAFLVYPAFSIGTILLVLALSALFFRERPGRRQLAGIGLILGALALLNL